MFRKFYTVGDIIGCLLSIAFTLWFFGTIAYLTQPGIEEWANSLFE